MKIKPQTNHKSFCTRPRPHFGPCYDHSLEELKDQPDGVKAKRSWARGIAKRYGMELGADLNDAFEDGVLFGVALSRQDKPASGPPSESYKFRWHETTPARTWESIR